MRGGPGVWARTRRLEGRWPRSAPGAEDLAERLAAELGIPTGELLAEAADVAARCAAAGATTPEAAAALLAAEVGCDPAEALAEVERAMAGAGRGR